MRARPALIALAAAPLLVLPSAAGAADGGRPFATDLTGAAELQPADADATGHAALTLNQGRSTVCFDLSWADIDGEVIAGHIHIGSADVNGPVVVGLLSGGFAGTDTASGCLTGVDPALVKDIRKNPANYYVNIHSTVYPAGAVRGQLG